MWEETAGRGDRYDLSDKIDLIAGIERLVKFYKLSRVPRGIQDQIG